MHSKSTARIQRAGSNALRLILALTVFSVLATLKGSTEGLQTAASPRKYTFSRHAGDEILSIGWSCTPYPLRRFALYGDGRLVGRRKGCLDEHPDAEPPEEVWLAPEEVAEIVETVVDAGLVEYKPGDIGEKLGPPTAPMDDEVGLVLRVSLSTYDGLRRREVKPFVHTTGVDAPMSLMTEYRRAKADGRIADSEPDTFLEAEALLEIYELLEQLVYGAK